MTVHKIEWNGVYWETTTLIGTRTITGVVGGSAVDMLPHACAPYITANTDDVKKRARKYFMGFADDQSDASTLDSAAYSALINLATEWLTDIIVEAGTELVPALAGLGGAEKLLLTAIVSNLIGSQRRRKPGVGV